MTIGQMNAVLTWLMEEQTGRPTEALALGSWAWENRSLIQGRIDANGGDSESMSLRRFLNVAYAILVEEYQRLGIDLISALGESVRAR